MAKFLAFLSPQGNIHIIEHSWRNLETTGRTQQGIEKFLVLVYWPMISVGPVQETSRGPAAPQRALVPHHSLSLVTSPSILGTITNQTSKRDSSVGHMVCPKG
jgi:hypothetical protein